MAYSVAFYSWINIASFAKKPADLKRILEEARAELTAEEYESLVDVLGKNQVTKQMLDTFASAGT